MNLSAANLGARRVTLRFLSRRMRKAIEEDSELRKHEFHELSVPVLKNVIERAVDFLISDNEVVRQRVASRCSETGLGWKVQGL